MSTANPSTLVDLGVDVGNVNEDDLIDFAEAARLVRGRGGRINRQVLQRHANPRRGRLFIIKGERLRLVLPSVARVTSRFTTAAWVEAWKRKFAELADRVLAEGQAPPRPKHDLPCTPKQAKREHERAVEELRKRGFKSAGA